MGIWLVMKTSALEERPFQLQKERTVIGRAATTDVRVPIPGIAPRHCEIMLDGDRVRLNDLSSEPGVLHNGERVAEAWLTHEDEVTVGSVTFTIRMADPLL